MAAAVLPIGHASLQLTRMCVSKNMHIQTIFFRLAILVPMLVAALAMTGMSLSNEPTPPAASALIAGTESAPLREELSKAGLATTFEGAASCARPAFLAGDTIGDANPAQVLAALCSATSDRSGQATKPAW